MMMSDVGEQIRVMGGAGLLSHSGFLCQPLPQCCLYSQQQSTDCCYDDDDLRTFAFGVGGTTICQAMLKLEISKEWLSRS